MEFDSDESWGGFELMHGMAHQKVYDTINQKDTLGNVPAFSPLFDFPREDNSDYLLDHWRVHQSNAQLLGITLPYYLSTADFQNQSSFVDWLAQHAVIHANENTALGLS